MKSNVNKPVENFRVETGKGFAEYAESTEDRIEPEGGRYGAGLIRGFAVITKGEARGHGMWIDSEFVSSVYEAMQNGRGLKSRYTHPGMSSDGLSKSLGRAFGAEVEGDIVYSDLHLSKSSHKSPDGDLAEHVLSRATEDAESFGSSIVFQPDYEAERSFYEEHTVEYEYEGRDGNKHKGYRFESPDPANTDNLPHSRLGELHAVDIVDDPAANPDGLFCVDPVYQEIESCASFALGLTDEKPQLTSLDVEPDRMASFLQRFLDSKGLQLMSKEKEQEPAVDEVTTSVSEPEKFSADDVEALIKERGEKYTEAFGDIDGPRYLAAGLSFEEASIQFGKDAKAKLQEKDDVIEQLESKIEHLENSSSEAVNAGTPDKEAKPRFNFVNN